MFALTAALNPTLLTATTVMLLLPNPRRLMLGYLAGALTTGLVVGIAIVQWLSGSGAVSETQHTLAPGVDLALGILALIAAGAVRRGRSEHAQGRHRGKAKKTPRWQQTLSSGSPRTTYLVGLLLSFPGASYLAALTEISRQNLSTAGAVVTVVAVNAVMLALLELPLISFAVAPDWTPLAIDRFKDWLGEHGASVLVKALTAIGLLLIARAIITFVV